MTNNCGKGGAALTATAVRSLPPCGGGLGRGVPHDELNPGTPTPDLSPQGGGEQTEFAAIDSINDSHPIGVS